MWYAIEGYDPADALPKRLAARPAHLARLTALRGVGLVVPRAAWPTVAGEMRALAGTGG